MVTSCEFSIAVTLLQQLQQDWTLVSVSGLSHFHRTLAWSPPSACHLKLALSMSVAYQCELIVRSTPMALKNVTILVLKLSSNVTIIDALNNVLDIIFIC